MVKSKIKVLSSITLENMMVLAKESVETLLEDLKKDKNFKQENEELFVVTQPKENTIAVSSYRLGWFGQKVLVQRNIFTCSILYLDDVVEIHTKRYVEPEKIDKHFEKLCSFYKFLKLTVLPENSATVQKYKITSRERF